MQRPLKEKKPKCAVLLSMLVVMGLLQRDSQLKNQRNCPRSQLQYHWCLLLLHFQTIFSRNTQWFHGMFRKKQFELCSSLKFEGKEQQTEHIRDISLTKEQVETLCLVTSWSQIYSFLIASDGLQVETPPTHTSHHLSFFRTRAYLLCTDRT